MEQVLGSSSEDVLDAPVAGGRSLTTQQRRDIDLSSTIPGWGSDLDPRVRPGVPRDKAPQLGVEHLYPRSIEQQIARVRIHKSTEHARLTPVFGTSCPPSGISGGLRNMAYKWSEGRLAHWLTLLLADRVDMVEGIVSDLAHGHIPNVPGEMGLRSELDHNREAFIRKVAISTVCVIALIAYVRTRRQDRPSFDSLRCGDGTPTRHR